MLSFYAELSAQGAEYKVVTIVESIVPMGVGRSRMVESTQPVDVKQFTTERTEGKDTKMGDVDRKDLKVEIFKETKLLNFYSGLGINFQNIASNDALISSKMNELGKEGWELAFVTSGVEADAGNRMATVFLLPACFSKRNKDLSLQLQRLAAI